MIGVLVVTHGSLGEALIEAARMFVSNMQAVKAVGIFPGQGIEDLDKSVCGFLAEVASDDGVLCLVDIPGGSPARVLGSLAIGNTKLEVVSGVNLPMLVEVLLAREQVDLHELVEHALNSGSTSVMDLGNLVRREITRSGG